MLVVNPDGTIRGANAQAYEALGYPAGTLVGLSLAWISPPSRHDVLAHVRAALEVGARRSIRSALSREDGTIIDVDLTVNPCLGHAQGFVVIDIVPIRGEPPEADFPRAAPSTPATSMRVKSFDAPHVEDIARPTSVGGRAQADASKRTQRVSMVPASASPSDEVCEKLSACLQLVCWLRSERDGASGNERTSAHVVMEELSSLLEECRREIRAADMVPRDDADRTLRLVP